MTTFIVRKYFLCRDSIKQTEKNLIETEKYLEVHAQITNQKKFCATQKYLDFI